MSTLIEAARRDDLKDGSMKKVKFQKLDILLARINGKYYAVDNRCPHSWGEIFPKANLKLVQSYALIMD